MITNSNKGMNEETLKKDLDEALDALDAEITKVIE